MNNTRIYRLILGLFGLSSSVFLLYQMADLADNRQLWGTRPLGFWISFWGGFLFILSCFSSKKTNQYILASVASGLLLSLSFVPLPFFITLFVGFIPLLWVERQLSKETKQTSKWKVLWYSFNSFLIWNFLSTSWVINTGFVAGIIANVLNALFMTAPFLFYHIARQYHNKKIGVLSLIAYWISFEYGHMQWEISWPWLTLGNSFAHFPFFVQWYEYTGVFGGSLWILGINVIVAERFFEALNHLEIKSPGTVLSAFVKSWLWKPLWVLGLPITVSIITYYTYDEGQGKALEVVSLQPNYEPHYEKFAVPEMEQLYASFDLAKKEITANTTYLLLPETILGSMGEELILNDLNKAESIQKIRKFVSQYPQLNTILGISATELYKSTDGRLPPKGRYLDPPYRFNKQSYDYKGRYNAAIQINNESDNIQSYKKSKLVVGAENMPYIGNLELFKSLILNLGGASELGLGTQANRVAFSSKTARVAPLICYESVYGSFTTNYINPFGAQVLFVLTNDGWWDNSLGHIQHMHFSRLRAIETRRYVVRSANTGISCFINSRGDILSQTQYDEAVALKGTIQLDDRITFYVRYKDLIARIALLLTCILILSSFVKWWQRLQRVEMSSKK